MITKTNSLTDVIIELHVPDFSVTKEFYSKLGFEVIWEYPPKAQSGYLVMKRNNSILSFFCGNEEVYNHPHFRKFPKDTPRGYGVEVAIYICDKPIDEYYEELLQKIDKSSVVESLTEKPWGKDFRLVDPFGYYLCFREPDDILIP